MNNYFKGFSVKKKM